MSQVGFSVENPSIEHWLLVHSKELQEVLRSSKFSVGCYRTGERWGVIQPPALIP